MFAKWTKLLVKITILVCYTCIYVLSQNNDRLNNQICQTSYSVFENADYNSIFIHVFSTTSPLWIYSVWRRPIKNYFRSECHFSVSIHTFQCSVKNTKCFRISLFEILEFGLDIYLNFTFSSSFKPNFSNFKDKQKWLMREKAYL